MNDSLFGLSASSDRSGFIGGGQLGVNYQFSNIVLGAWTLGLRLDIARRDREWPFCSGLPNSPGIGPFLPLVALSQSEIEGLESAYPQIPPRRSAA